MIEFSFTCRYITHADHVLLTERNEEIGRLLWKHDSKPGKISLSLEVLWSDKPPTANCRLLTAD